MFCDIVTSPAVIIFLAPLHSRLWSWNSYFRIRLQVSKIFGSSSNIKRFWFQLQNYLVYWKPLHYLYDLLAPQTRAVDCGTGTPISGSGFSSTI